MLVTGQAERAHEGAGVSGVGHAATVVLGVWMVHGAQGVRIKALLGAGTGFAYLTLATTVAYGLLDKSAMARLDPAEWTGPMPRSVFYFFASGVSCLVYLLPLALSRLALADLRETARLEWRRALAAGVISLCSYGLILEALRTASASYVVAARQLSVLFAVALSVLWLREQPGRARMLGAAATVVGVALIAAAR